MLFSIITPTMNSAAHLEATINSVLKQQEADFEYLLIDGGSTDDTLAIIRHHAAADHRIRWISEPDRGISDAFNKGIALACGEIVGIINSDVMYEEGTFAAVSKQFADHPDGDLVHGDMLRMEDEQPLFRMVPGPVEKLVWREMPINHPAVFVRLKTYREFGILM